MAKIESHRQLKKSFLLLTQDFQLLQVVKVKIQGKSGYCRQPAHVAGAGTQVASQLHSTHARVVVCKGRSRLVLLLLTSRMLLFLSSRQCLGKAPRMHYKCTETPESMTLNTRKTSLSLILQCLSIPTEAS